MAEALTLLPRRARLWRLFVAALALALWAALTLAAFAAPPALTGRVVDQAGILSAPTQEALTQKLDALEQKSSIQFVVATVSSLDGGDIETYANRLFRDWKLGQVKKNNGLLLLVAPNERKVRIEVGYGLEGVLTDALAKVIIVNAITPRFKAGRFDEGVTRGVDDVITVLTTDQSEWEQRPDFRAEDQASLIDALLPFIVFAIFIFVGLAILRSSRAQVAQGRRRGHVIVLPPTSGSWGGGWSGGGGSDWGGGGFSGGGGSSGGGGASGGW